MARDASPAPSSRIRHSARCSSGSVTTRLPSAPASRVTAFAAATEGGHACLGWPSAGRIEAGGLADLVTYRLDSQRLAGTSVEHAIPSLVFSGTAADVTNVVVGGRDVVRGGAHTQLDVAGELDGAMRAVWR